MVGANEDLEPARYPRKFPGKKQRKGAGGGEEDFLMSREKGVEME